jgi:hypothetical protein
VQEVLEVQERQPVEHFRHTVLFEKK